LLPSLSNAFKELTRTFHAAERASTSVRSQIDVLEKELEAANRKAALMLTELQVAKNQTRQAGLACKTEKMARIAAEDELRTLKDDLEAR
jgi:chromosome segregation ATPase